MKLLIERKDLELLLEKRKHLFRNEEIIAGVISSLGFIVSVITGSFPDFIVSGHLIRLAFAIIAILSLFYYTFKAFRKYNKDDFLKEIEELNMIERASSIVAIKNTQNPRKYLLYNDKDWGVKFFPNYSNYKNNSEEEIKRKLSEQLGVKPSDIKLSFKTHGNEEKASTEHDNEIRKYSYDVYYATIKGFKFENDDTFNLDDKSYYWMTTDEMLDDDKIKEHNDYLVKLIRDNA